ncbi:MAG: DUF5980 family protein [Chloroflexota bacterium]
MSDWKHSIQLRVFAVMIASFLLLFSLAPAQGQNWELVQSFPGTKCMTYRDGGIPQPTLWLLIDLSGSWTSPVEFGIRDLPEGMLVSRSTFVNGNPAPYQPIAPGSGDGALPALGRVELTSQIKSVPTATYTATLWANDGTTERTSPVTIVVQNARCRY